MAIRFLDEEAKPSVRFLEEDGGIDNAVSTTVGDNNRITSDSSADVVGLKDVGILERTFDVPSAPAREAIRENPRLATLGPLAGLAGLSGVGGRKAQSKALEAIKKPSTSEKFQDEAIRKAQDEIANRASKRTGIFAPNTKLGKFIMGAELVNMGNVASGVGFAQDFATNPADVLMSLGDIVSSGKALFGAAKEIKVSKNALSTFKQAVKPSTAGIKRAKDIAISDKKLAQGIIAVVENTDNLRYANDIDNIGRLPETLEEGVSAYNQTRKDIAIAFNKLRQYAGDDAFIDMTDVATDVFSDVFTEGKILADPQGVGKVISETKRLLGEGKVTLDVAEETLQSINATLEPFYRVGGGSLKDISKAKTQAKIASSLRKRLDDVILKETGQAYSELKNTYGALVEGEKNLVKRVNQLSKITPRSGAEVLDTVPIIYGAFTGNVPLVAAGVGQKIGNKFIKSLKDQNTLFRKTFKAVSDSNKSKVFPVGLTTITSGRALESLVEE